MGAIADRVALMLSEEESVMEWGPEMFCGTWPPKPDDAYLTFFELNLRDWGMVYGICFALARQEDAFEPRKSVAERALEEAKIVWKVRQFPEWVGREGFNGDREWRPVPAEEEELATVGAGEA